MQNNKKTKSSKGNVKTVKSTAKKQVKSKKTELSIFEQIQKMTKKFGAIGCYITNLKLDIRVKQDAVDIPLDSIDMKKLWFYYHVDYDTPIKLINEIFDTNSAYFAAQKCQAAADKGYTIPSKVIRFMQSNIGISNHAWAIGANEKIKKEAISIWRSVYDI